MSKSLTTRAAGIVALSALLLLPCPHVLADGIPAYWDDHTWRIAPEEAQFAVVKLDKGRETMLLQVALGRDLDPEQARKLVWVTPIPARPDQVKIDILRGFPTFGGVLPLPWLISQTRETLTIMSFSQVGPIFIVPFFFLYGAKSSPDGLAIHAHIQKDGVELSVVEAASVEALAQHLEKLGVGFPQVGLNTLKPYTGPQACLAVFRIADFAKYQKATTGEYGQRTPLGIEVDFPTTTGFFPLVASSALPGEHLEVVVTAIGYHQAVNPRPPGLGQSHYLGHIYGPNDLLASIGLEPSQEIRYTRFHLFGAPKNLTADLRFEPGAPKQTMWITDFIQGPWFTPLAWISWLAVFLALAISASLIARWVWPKEDRPTKKVSALLGLFNLLTWLGYLAAVLIYAHKRGIAKRRSALVALASNLVFCLLNALLVLMVYSLE